MVQSTMNPAPQQYMVAQLNTAKFPNIIARIQGDTVSLDMVSEDQLNEIVTPTNLLNNNIVLCLDDFSVYVEDSKIPFILQGVNGHHDIASVIYQCNQSISIASGDPLTKAFGLAAFSKNNNMSFLIDAITSMVPSFTQTTNRKKIYRIVFKVRKWSGSNYDVLMS